MNFNVLAVMWIFLAVAAAVGIALGAFWREISLRKRWRATEAEFAEQLRTQVATRDEKILKLEGSMNEPNNRSAEPSAAPATFETPRLGLVEQIEAPVADQTPEPEPAMTEAVVSMSAEGSALATTWDETPTVGNVESVPETALEEASPPFPAVTLMDATRFESAGEMPPPLPAIALVEMPDSASAEPHHEELVRHSVED